MKWFDIFVTIIIFIKVLFIITALLHIYYKVKKQENSKNDKLALHWKERFEFVFTILMAALLIMLFNPRTGPKPVYITGETKLLLYLFGCVLLLTANWSVFIKEAPWFKQLSIALRN